MNMFISVISEAFIFYHASVWAVSQSVSWGQIATYWFASIDDTCLAPTRGFSPPSCKTSKNHHRQTSEHLGDDSPHSFQCLEYLAAALVGRLSRMRCDWIGCQIFFFFFFEGGNLQICHHLSFCSGLYCTVCWLCCVAFSASRVSSLSFHNEYGRLIKLCIITRLHLPSQLTETFPQSRLKIKSLIEKQKGWDIIWHEGRETGGVRELERGELQDMVRMSDIWLSWGQSFVSNALLPSQSYMIPLCAAVHCVLWSSCVVCSRVNLVTLDQLEHKMFVWEVTQTLSWIVFFFCHFDDSPWLISSMLDLNPCCVCLRSSEHWAQAAEGRPHGHTPPPAGHEDRPGSSSAGLLPQAAGRRARTGTKHQQVSLCLLLLLSENRLQQWDTTNKYLCSCPGGTRTKKIQYLLNQHIHILYQENKHSSPVGVQMDFMLIFFKCIIRIWPKVV